MPNLSLRLKTIADMVPVGAKVCDVGTDHGYLAIYLKLANVVEKIIATDLNEKPLKRAEKNITSAGVKGIELRLCDGLSGLEQDEADTIIIAGMGGEVIAGILEKGGNISKSENITFIMQPTTSPEILRRFLCENGYEIEREIPISENGKVYSVMVCRFDGLLKEKDNSFYYVGKIKPNCKAGVLYIEKQKKRCFDCMTALKSKEDKKYLYAHYKSAFEGIDELLTEENGE